jgi:carboxypeptidase family protein
VRFPKGNLWMGVFLSLAILLCAGSAWAQAGTSNIRGVVTDPSGATVPKATVTITNLRTNFTRTQVTTENGSFAFELIPPGEYRVEVTAQGFSKKVLTPVQALVGLPVDASMQLAVGSIAEVVSVEAVSTAVQVNTQDATLGNSFVSAQITQLPLESRNIQSLLTLQPGVTGSPGASGYVSGARSDQSNVTLDGVDINEAQTNGLTDTVLRLNSEAIEEFRVTTVNANANQGRSSAAQINLVTKSGTNDIRGTLFYYNRSTGFTANNFFNNRVTPKPVARPALIRNTFGGTVGGPIIKDKLFFFYSYEGRTDASAVSVARQVPLPHLGLGQVKYRDSTGTVQTLSTADINTSLGLSPNNSNVPCNAIAGCTWLTVDPAAVAALGAAAAAYPANDNTQGDNLNTGGFRFNAPIRVDNNSNVGKIDWNINSKMTFFARANFIYDLSGAAPQFPDTPAPNTWSHPYGGVVSHNWTLARNWVNNFRYGYTREAFSQQGDSVANNMSFRFVFSPLIFQRELSRTTPVQNIIDDVSWIHGNHTIQFGTNIRLISNGRVSFANAFDTGLTNPTLYNNSGNTIVPPISTFLSNSARPAIIASDQTSVRDNVSALIGGLSQYTARFTFDASGALLPSGTGSHRTFATQEYDGYILDNWRVNRTLTVTAGLRYSISRPVYETHGFEVKPNIAMDDYFNQRVASAQKGVNLATPITLNLSGPANGASPLYRWDKNNFQPRISIAWSPNFQDGFLQLLFGRSGSTVFRGGYAMTNDYYGQSLAVLFDLNNTLGFTSSSNINANQYDTSTALGKPLPPVFTGYNQVIRTLPNLTVPVSISFPRTQPSDMQRRIETGLDEGLVAPVNHVWNFTIERELPKGLVVGFNYTGRLGRNLLAQRDAMALSDLVDPVSGVDFYTAMGQLQTLRATFPQFCIASTSVCGVPYNTIQNIPYFENIFSAANLGAPLSSFFGAAYAGLSATQTLFRRITRSDKSDTTTTQDLIEFFTGKSFFYNPQYGALSTWGTFGNSNYHGASITVRQRLRGILWDFNYTFSHSLDDASGLQANGSFSGSALVLNPVRQRFSHAASGFDIRHQINVNAVYELPFGRGKMFGATAGRALDAVIGGWQLSGIFRWNTGLPVSGPFDNGHWATNWQVSSGMMLTRNITPCVTTGSTTQSPKLFGGCQTYVYQSFRSPLPGEIGTRNIIRLPGYVNADMGLAKSFTMPYNEKHRLQLRWEVFNVTNTQRLGGVGGTTAHVIDPLTNNSLPPSNWFNLTSIQGSPRVMQIGFRFEF